MTDLYVDLAELYEAAFSWDRTAEIAWLAQLIPHRETVLEPMCGPGYLLEAFAARGHATIGVDSSTKMLDIARRRFERAGLSGRWIEADVCEFELDVACGGAFCAVNSVALLPSVGAMGRHLRAMGRALHHGAPYLVQLDMATPEGVRKRIGAATEQGRWTFRFQDRDVSIEWFSEDVDDRFDHQVARFTFPDGSTFEHRDKMKLWSWDAWSALIEVSPFREEAAFSGDDGQYTSLPLDRTLDDRPLTWHYLTRR
jgi:SAM-dependent methyltransferase